MGQTTARILVLDAGALIAIEKALPKMIAILDLGHRSNVRFLVPTTVLAQVWRGGHRQARLSLFFKLPGVEIVPFSEGYSKASGVLCGARQTSDAIDSSVAILGRKHRAAVVTSDPEDIAHLDPSLQIIAV